MELKVKYQYTYFIKPFLIEEEKYQKYLLSLIKNKKFKLKIFEKERDNNLYSFFIKNIRNYFFPTFEFNREEIRDFENMIDSLKAKKLSELHCNIFEYRLENRIQGKVDEKQGIFFDIDKIEIVCLDTGVCFLVIKTNSVKIDIIPSPPICIKINITNSPQKVNCSAATIVDSPVTQTDETAVNKASIYVIGFSLHIGNVSKKLPIKINNKKDTAVICTEVNLFFLLDSSILFPPYL